MKTRILSKCLALLIALVQVLVAWPTAVQAQACGSDQAATSPAVGPGPTDPAEVEAFLDSVMSAQMAEKHVAGAVVSVVKDGKLLFAKGYGYADVASQTPVDPEKTLFRIGSVTKLFVWTAVMQLSEQGKLDFDADVNQYLDFQIPATYPKPITLKHLLTHTAGFEECCVPMWAHDLTGVLPLGKFVAENVPARVRPPGEVSSYSNYGASLAAYVVERVSGESWEGYVEKHILQPLGMSSTTPRQDVPANLKPDLAKAYSYENGAYKEQPFELIAGTAPAGAMSASATDMARFMVAHLQNGVYGDARILGEATAIQMHSRLFANDPRLNGVDYGFFETSQNGQRIIGHGGTMVYHHTYLALLPDQNVGVFVSYNSQSGGSNLAPFLKAFMDRYYPTPAFVPPQPDPDTTGRLARFGGNYRPNRGFYTKTWKVSGLLGGGGILTVTTAGDGALRAPAMSGTGELQRYVEVEPLLFRSLDGEQTLAFREDSQGQITHVFVDSLPYAAYETIGPLELPALHQLLLQIAAVLFLTTLVIWPVGALIRRRRRAPVDPRPARIARWLVVAIVALDLLFAGIFAVNLSNILAIQYGVPLTMRIALALPPISAALTVGAIALGVLAWWRGYWGRLGRVHYTVVVIFASIFVAQLAYWNLLGWRF